jgi:hypothetical protein
VAGPPLFVIFCFGNTITFVKIFVFEKKVSLLVILITLLLCPLFILIMLDETQDWLIIPSLPRVSCCPLPPLTLLAYCSTSFLSLVPYLSYQSLIIYDFSGLACPCSALCHCLFFWGSSWAPCHWLLLLARVGVAFIERRLSLLILFIIFYCVHKSLKRLHYQFSSFG